MPCTNAICSAATISYLIQHHLTLRSVSFLLTRPLEAYGSQLPPRCFTLRVQHLVLGSASYSDATVRLQRFEASAVSHSLHGKTEYHVFFKCVCVCVVDRRFSFETRESRCGMRSVLLSFLNVPKCLAMSVSMCITWW